MVLLESIVWYKKATYRVSIQVFEWMLKKFISELFFQKYGVERAILHMDLKNPTNLWYNSINITYGDSIVLAVTIFWNLYLIVELRFEVLLFFNDYSTIYQFFL